MQYQLPTEIIYKKISLLAREALVQVEALLLLGTPLEEVELAELHDLRRVSCMREVTSVSILWTLSLHEERTDLGRLFRRPRISVSAFQMWVSVGPGWTSLEFSVPSLSHR